MTDEQLIIPKGITRHEYARSKGWLVRVYRTRDGEQRCARRLFSDGVYGGELEALDAATAWQQEQQENSPREKKRTPGYGYVQRAMRSYKTASGVKSYEAFVAWFWDEQSRLSSTSWSIPTHGENEAEARCEAWLASERAKLAVSYTVPLAQAG